MAQRITFPKRQTPLPFGGGGGVLANRLAEEEGRMKRAELDAQHDAEVLKDKQEARALAQQKFAHEKLKFQAGVEANGVKAITDALKARRELNEQAQLGPYMIAVESLNPIDPDFDNELEALDAKYRWASGTKQGRDFAHGPGSIQARFKATQDKYREAEDKIGYDAVRKFARYSAKDGSFVRIDIVGLNDAVARRKIDEKRALVPSGVVTINPKGDVTIAEPKPMDEAARADKDKAEALRLRKEKRYQLDNVFKRNATEIQQMKDSPKLFEIAAKKSGWATPEQYIAARTADLQKQNWKLTEDMKVIDSVDQTQAPVSEPTSQSPQQPAPVTQPETPATQPSPVPESTPTSTAPTPKKPAYIPIPQRIKNMSTAPAATPAPTAQPSASSAPVENTTAATTIQNDSDGDGVLDADEIQGSTVQVEDDADGNPMMFAVTEAGAKIPVNVPVKRKATVAAKEVASAMDEYS